MEGFDYFFSRKRILLCLIIFSIDDIFNNISQCLFMVIYKIAMDFWKTKHSWYVSSTHFMDQ